MQKLVNTNNITLQEYNKYYSNIIDFAINHDNSNNFLIQFKELLLERNENLSLLSYKLIYLQNNYSVLIKDPLTNILTPINYNASNLLELYIKNLESIEQHKLEFDRYYFKIANSLLVANIDRDETLKQISS